MDQSIRTLGLIGTYIARGRDKRQETKESPIGNWPSLQLLDSWPKLVNEFRQKSREWHVAGPPCPDKNLRNVHPVPVPVPPTLTSPLFGILQQLSWPMPTGPAPLPVSLPQFFGPGIGLVDRLPCGLPPNKTFFFLAGTCQMMALSRPSRHGISGHDGR
jgi:hypothetical protein